MKYVLSHVREKKTGPWIGRLLLLMMNGWNGTVGLFLFLVYGGAPDCRYGAGKKMSWMILLCVSNGLVDELGIRAHESRKERH